MLRAAEAQLALAKVVLKDTQLYAPSNGVIQNRILEPGDMASPQTPVYTLALTDLRTLGMVTPFGGSAFAHPDSREAWFAEARRQAEAGMRDGGDSGPDPVDGAG